jgi:hypothetical protein
LMSSDRTRARIIELIADMRARTVANGCTPGEAAKFAAKVAEWVEKYQIDEAELRAKGGDPTPEEIEVCENILRTGGKVHNPGVTAVVAGLARGMCCEVILLNLEGEAAYGITGESLDADYVCQVATMVVPALKSMAKLEGIEHGYEKAGLIRWCNQYLTGAGTEIQRRLERERKDRSDARAVEHKVSCMALVLVTGETIAAEKREAVSQVFKQKYPSTRTTRSRMEYNHDAY